MQVKTVTAQNRCTLFFILFIESGRPLEIELARAKPCHVIDSLCSPPTLFASPDLTERENRRSFAIGQTCVGQACDMEQTHGQNGDLKALPYELILPLQNVILMQRRNGYFPCIYNCPAGLILDHRQFTDAIHMVWF